MDPNSLKPWSVVFARAAADELHRHLFPGDADEHGAVLLCGVADRERSRRLLVREVLLARDGIDYVAGHGSYRTLTPAFVAQAIERAARENLAYLAVHNHLGTDYVGFSPTDLQSHERGYPALLDITRGGPVGALVFAERAVAGDIWERAGRTSVDRTIVLGACREIFYPSPPAHFEIDRALYDRQIRLFGEAGQALLGGLRVGVVGLGGAGSMISQALAHLGVGAIIGLDRDIIEASNRPRVVAAQPADVHVTPKVNVAGRVAKAVRPEIEFVPLKGDIVDPDMASAFLDCDALFLAADSMVARHVVNAISHQYLIPCFQVGAKVTSTEDLRVADVFTVSRVVGPGGICLWCGGLINATRLQEESLSEEERRAFAYVDDVPAPSVFTLNAMSTAQALNDFLFMVTGLHTTDDLGPRWYFTLRRQFQRQQLEPAPTGCRECTDRRARGDRGALPLRLSGR